jgi:hypothetical protein
MTAWQLLTDYHTIVSALSIASGAVILIAERIGWFGR